MAAGSTVTAMKTAVRRGAAAATLGQARRRYLIGGRPLASSKPRMNGRDEISLLIKRDYRRLSFVESSLSKLYRQVVLGQELVCFLVVDKMAQLKDFIEKLDFKTFETKFYETTASGAKAGKNLAAASVSPLRSIYDFLEVRSMALPHEWIWRCNLAGIFFASLVAGNVAADEWGKRTNTKQKLLLDEAGKQEAAREGFLKS